MMEAPPPDKPMFSFYGDDFTGSTDALEALAGKGVDSVLFLRPPGDADLVPFAHCRAVGIAGDSRSRSPEWMRAALPAVFARLREIGAPIIQYKVCSTFDSAPETGSIGCALEIGQDVFAVPFVPIVAAAPPLKRYVLFGNLFAAGGDSIHRIDRHPTMKQHPVTPMTESDLRLHLARQTRRSVALLDILALHSPDADARLERLLARRPDAVLFDGLQDESLARVARLIWRHRGAPQTFVVGSSGFTYGMVDFWRAQGWLAEGSGPPQPRRTDRLLVLSGSCSPATERQIQGALRDGFCGIRLDAARIEESGSGDAYLDSVRNEALRHLAEGRSVVLYTARGPSDVVDLEDRHALATQAGKLLRQLIVQSGVRRVMVVGGDTASHAVRELEITALTFLAATEPGAPLCKAHGGPPGLEDLELVLKGGQIGSESFFEDVLRAG
jgi:uncharacterized protein YgbK (DUF1537 family)